MNKKLALPLLSLSLLFTSAVALASNKEIKETKADSAVEYCDIGPGVFNPAQTNTPLDRFDGNNYSISVRGGSLLLYPNKDYYQGIPFNNAVTALNLIDTDFDLIRIYTNETTYRPLSAVSSTASINVYSDAGYNCAFPLSSSVVLKNIYKITIAEGFTLPYASNDHSKKLVVKRSLTFEYNGYLTSDATDTFFSSSWAKSNYEGEGGSVETPIELLPIAAFARQAPDYRCHIRGYIVDYDNEDRSVDNGTCKLIFFFGDTDYNYEIYNQSNVDVNASKFDMSDAETSYIHTLYENIILTDAEGNSKTLLDMADPREKGVPTYNTWGEKCCISFNIGKNYGNESSISYSGLDISTITVKRGTQFPSYAYTNGGSKVETRYEQIDDITVSFYSHEALWGTSCEYSFTAADIDVSEFNARKVELNTSELNINSTVIDIKLSECNYTGMTNKEILTVGEVLTKYVYVNGRAIYYLFKDYDFKAYANLDGKENTLSILIPMEVSEVNEIIVQKGCAIPAVVASAKSMEYYGNSISYYVSNSVSFSKNNEGNLVEDSKIYWTLWFDGKDPHRVSNTTVFDLDSVSPGETNETQRFVKWVDADNNEVKGYVKITSGKEYFGSYIYIYKVTMLGLDKDISIRVDNLTRLTSTQFAKYKAPTKKGYIFVEWQDEEGNHFNFDNMITRDITITAIWQELDKTVVSTGCGGSISTTITIFLLTIPTLVIGLAIRKKQH